MNVNRQTICQCDFIISGNGDKDLSDNFNELIFYQHIFLNPQQDELESELSRVQDHTRQLEAELETSRQAASQQMAESRGVNTSRSYHNEAISQLVTVSRSIVIITSLKEI